MSVKQIVLAARPSGMPDASVFRTENVELPPLQAGQLHIRGLYFSVDPYMRGRMNDAPSYIPPFQLNAPIEGAVVAEVLESQVMGYNPGDLITGGLLPWATEAIVSAEAIKPIDTQSIPPGYYLGVLGSAGITAYCGMVIIGRPKAGETVVVSGAAGAVGLVAGQIAKIMGCRVVGIAGSEEKIRRLKTEFGFDEAINYKTTPDMGAALAAACPKGIDIYFDNVGGTTTDAVFPLLNFQARVPVCGQISSYNDTATPPGPRILPQVVKRSILIQGFLVRYMKEYHAEAALHLTQWLKENKLQFEETVVEGFDRLPEAWLGLFSGQNMGKMIVKA
ncbi:MAG TPA: NADP-dependent oxidoreductase [Chitinophaga sp.]|uniref:NADP-dependent oxidoreductase n=1 Tax=Chitinophaga sp. TaxID=1869181 RepID=UPI002F932C22